MNNSLVKWIEQYLFFPNSLQKLLSIALLPLTLIYTIIVTFKRVSAKPQYFGIPVISVGNLLVGGTGKTPVTIALAKKYSNKNVAIVLRGYGRDSKGLFVVSNKGKILEDVKISGDEAMLLANSLPNATVIVSENRKEAILKAKELGCEIVFLDDGYTKYDIFKFDLLLRPKNEPTNVFCLPSGGYRDSKMMYSFADFVLKEDVDFKRVVSFKDVTTNNLIEELPQDIVVATAISKSKRLLEYLPQDTKLISFPDHYSFTKEDIDNICTKYPNSKIVTTAKDLVKLKEFQIGSKLILMDLEVTINDELYKLVDSYIEALES